MIMCSDFHTAVRSGWRLCALLTVAALVGGCDSSPLLAPTQSTITVSAPARILPNGGSIEITAYVIEQAGTAVQNGTAVRFTTTLGTVEPTTALTHNGIARTVFSAGNVSGIAEIRATSGTASGGEGSLNLVRVTVGAAAVSAVTLRANPGSIGPSGGTVELIASVVGENGEAVEGVGVTFNTDQGSLGSSTATTNAGGEARTTLTTSQQAVVSASAGTKTSANLTIGVRAGPIVSITCAPAAGTGTCGAVQVSGPVNSAAVLLTVTKAATSSTLRSARLDFGDGESLDLGNLASGSATVTHTYAGPSGPNPRTYTATVRTEDVNGETTSASTTVIVLPRSPISVAITTSSEPATTAGQRWTFTATVTGDSTPSTIQSYTWDFGDGSSVTTSGGSTAHVYTVKGKITVTVTVQTLDGRTVSATTEILIP